jgi:hypothetical protein
MILITIVPLSSFQITMPHEILPFPKISHIYLHYIPMFVGDKHPFTSLSDPLEILNLPIQVVKNTPIVNGWLVVA